jgi:hypothetical protein
MIMPNIRVSDWNKVRLESLGRFGDCHDSVLGRALDLILGDRRLADKVRVPAQAQAQNFVNPALAEGDSRTRARKGTVTGERFFIPHILAVLKNAKNHSMHCSEVLRELERLVPRERLSPLDFDKLPSGAVRWANKAQWARKIMVDEGLLEPVEKAGHGVWKLTEAGLAQARKA